MGRSALSRKGRNTHCRIESRYTRFSLRVFMDSCKSPLHSSSAELVTGGTASAAGTRLLRPWMPDHARIAGHLLFAARIMSASSSYSSVAMKSTPSSMLAFHLAFTASSLLKISVALFIQHRAKLGEQVGIASALAQEIALTLRFCQSERRMKQVLKAFPSLYLPPHRATPAAA
jgi:hypothetical protein